MNRNAFKAKVAGLFADEEVNFIMTAYDISKAAHRTQEREEIPQDASITEKRYFNHPKRIALRMLDAGIRDAYTICVALLHDCVEDTAIFGNQLTDGYYRAIEDARFRITNAFNVEVAEDVIALTIPKKNELVPEFSSKTKCLKFYKGKLSGASIRALLVKLFDRLDNLSTIEIKGLSIAQLKLLETAEFYIPLFSKIFSKQDTDLKKIGCVKTLELAELVAEKADLVSTNSDKNFPRIIKKGGFPVYYSNLRRDHTTTTEVATTETVFEGRFGKINIGEKVIFLMENQDSWTGDNFGILIHENGEFKIQTENSGTITIDKGYDAYGGTIKKCI